MGGPHLVIRNTHKMYQYSYLVFIYFNEKRPPLEFRFIEIILLVDLKYTIENMLPCLDNQRVVKLYYCSPSIDNERKIQLRKFELKNR